MSRREKARGRLDEHDAKALVEQALKQVADEMHWWVEPQVRQLPAVQEVLTAPDALRRDCLLWLASFVADDERDEPDRKFHARVVFRLAARKRLPLTASDARFLLEWLGLIAAEPREVYDSFSAAQVVKALAKQLEAAAPLWTEAECAQLAPLIEAVAAAVRDYPTSRRLFRLVRAREGLPLDVIPTGDDAAPRLRAVFESSSEREGALAHILEVLGSYPEKGKPSRAWLSSLDSARAALDDPAALAAGLLDALLATEDTESSYTYHGRSYPTIFFLNSTNDHFACALADLAGTLSNTSLLPRLRRLALKSVTFIGGSSGSPRSLRLANACAQAISQVASPASITELLALERAVKHGGLLREVRKAIDALAGNQGMTREELLERSVENHDLEPGGRLELPLSRGSAVIEVDATTAGLTYLNEHGARRKSFPADVKRADAEALAQLREKRKAIAKTLAGERSRLEAAMRLDRQWQLADWRELYLDHPITGRLTRALIWTFRGSDANSVVGIPLDERAVRTVTGERVPTPPNAEVRLWHPIHAGDEEVHAWRLHLLDALVVEPLKQAFRELYVLTPAEEETAVYSNRFAGHVFRQPQARALLKGRGWRPVPVAWWEDGVDHGFARRDFDPFGLRAEFFFDPILDIEPDTGDLYPYCTSDQVRFIDTRSDEPMALSDVPPLVFSEAMRDIDLVVAVSSVGADPEWLDRGEERRFETYWHDFSFGELSESAKIRREVLERLVPALSIADRCELEPQYLVVRGDVRTYRIHLGSGNILMSPNDQYLCIVAARDRRAAKLFLPFDDDATLSLVLSKAFMLADDRKITDPTIWAQIKPSYADQ